MNVYHFQQKDKELCLMGEEKAYQLVGKERNKEGVKKSQGFG